ncbi:membrane protein [Pelotomaculum thermopropionicum SI]|uniref:Membrane protein n=1 Tax=Pelotomaculum thermopropionicum (strain DSM 13744 / JCM 10971 / SI) TaxID=370438 RepID=A5D5C1_PELTS|nr:membrane protein [Pelotomaculum thermopropionicum SI]
MSTAKLAIPKSLGELKQYLGDPLYKNSFFIVLSRVSNVACGFFFWMLAARLYSTEDVGVATALISSLGLVIQFSRLGFDFSLIRFFPLNDRKKVFSTCLVITTISSFGVGIIYILGISLFSPELSFLKEGKYALIFILIAVINSIAAITGSTFVAKRDANYYFIQNLFMALRVPFLIPLTFLGCFGIFGANGLAFLLASLFDLLLLYKSTGLDLKVDKKFVRESFKFSSGNYISSMFLSVPTLVLPIMIVNLLGGSEAAKYYIAFSIGNLVLIVPDALSTSLFVEGSHGEGLKKNVIKAGLAIYAFLIPAVLFLYFSGGFLLKLFGKDYVDALELLRILSLSSFLAAVYSLFAPIQNVRMKVESIIKINLARFLLLLGLCYLFILKFGIVGVGYAWMITYMLLVIVIVYVAKKENWFKFGQMKM